MLIHLYSAYATPDKGKQSVKLGDAERNTSSVPNGHIYGRGAADRQARDFQDFELEALMSEDEDEPKTSGSNRR